jgi:hypothetical protein
MCGSDKYSLVELVSEGRMMAGLDPSILKRHKGPPVPELARRYPQQTVVHRYSPDEWLQVQFGLEAALAQSGIPGTDYVECSALAIDVLTGRLHDIAMRLGVEKYRLHTTGYEHGLEVTVVFETVAEAMLFKFALP